MTDFRDLCAELIAGLDGDCCPETQGNYYSSEAMNAITRARAALDEPEGGTSVEQVAQIVYENAMLATAPDYAKPHWPSWADLPNSDARIHALNTAEIILTRWGRPAIEPVPVAEPGVADHITDDEGCRWDRTMDAALWAKAFCLICPEMASREDVMIGWFANAIMAGCDHQAWKIDAEHKPVPVSERLPGDADCLVIPTHGASTFSLRYCWMGREIMHCGQARLLWDWKLVPHTTEEHWPFTYWLPASTRFLPTTVDPA